MGCSDECPFREDVERLRATLSEIHSLAMEHREFAIAGRCVTALGPGVPGVSAPPLTPAIELTRAWDAGYKQGHIDGHSCGVNDAEIAASEDDD